MSQITTYAAGTPNWVDLSTTDRAAAREFYAALLGWSYTDVGGYTFCTLGDHPVAAIAGQDPPEGAGSSWTAYLATDDSAATVARIGELGGTVLAGPLEMPTYGHVVYAVDPLGATIGTWEGTDLPGLAVVEEPGTFAWAELATPDLAASQAFYGGLAGYAFTPTGPGQVLAKIAGRPVASLVEADGAAAWGVTFAVADLDASLAELRRLGGEVHETSAQQGRVASVTDAVGAALRLSERSA